MHSSDLLVFVVNIFSYCVLSHNWRLTAAAKKTYDLNLIEHWRHLYCIISLFILSFSNGDEGRIHIKLNRILSFFPFCCLTQPITHMRTQEISKDYLWKSFLHISKKGVVNVIYQLWRGMGDAQGHMTVSCMPQDAYLCWGKR